MDFSNHIPGIAYANDTSFSILTKISCTLTALCLKQLSFLSMCRVIYDQCRFCETEKPGFLDLCNESKTGEICIERSFHLKPEHDLVDHAASYLRVTGALRRSQQRYTCSACEALTALVICITPISMATKDIDIRPAFSWSRHYCCPALLDAIHTAAKYSLVELQRRLRSGSDLRWDPIPEDYDIEIFENVGGSPVDGPSNHTMLQRITTIDRHEHRNSLLDGGQMGMALLSQQRRERHQLGELIALRRYLRDKLDAKQMREYKVVCDPEHSPIEHVWVALVVASTGGKLCRGARLRDVARRVLEWERYFDCGLRQEKRRLCEPQRSSSLLWVDRGFGKIHPDRIQEITVISRRQRLEQ